MQLIIGSFLIRPSFLYLLRTTHTESELFTCRYAATIETLPLLTVGLRLVLSWVGVVTRDVCIVEAERTVLGHDAFVHIDRIRQARVIEVVV